MVLTRRSYTADDLWTMPGDEPWELWDGELKRVPPAGAEPTTIASIVNFHLRLYLRDNDLGTVSSADGGYILFRRDGRDTVVAPDVGFVRWDRLPGGTLPKRGFFPVPPDLAVEIQSPSDEPAEMARKRQLYADAGLRLLWWVDPTARTVTVYAPGQPPRQLTDADTLDAADLLPGLAIPITDLFE